MSGRRWTARFGASLLVAAAGAVGLVGAPQSVLPAASAATCSGSTGVSVVVDFRELGGGLVTACAPGGGGKSATAIFAEAGVKLTYATRQPGFVCRVNGAPSSDPCVNASPADAYWGLWWGDGSKSTWTYSSQGASGATVPDGGAVGWSWQQDRAAGNTVPPGVAVPVTKRQSSPSPSPTATPSPSPTSNPPPGGGDSGGSGPAPTGPGAGTPSPQPSPGRGKPGKPGGGSTPGAKPPSSSAPAPSPTRSGATDAEADSPVEPGDSPTDTPSLDPESPSDSPASDPSGSPSDPAQGLGSESPSDSPSSGASTGAEAGSDAAAPDEPTRVPAAVTWGVVALLGVATVVSAVKARRRRTG